MSFTGAYDIMKVRKCEYKTGCCICRLGRIMAGATSGLCDGLEKGSFPARSGIYQNQKPKKLPAGEIAVPGAIRRIDGGALDAP